MPIESKLQQTPAKRIAAGDVVIGVVQMYDAMIHMIKALQASNKTLMQLQAAVDRETSQVDGLQVDQGYLDQLIQVNNKALGQVELDK